MLLAIIVVILTTPVGMTRKSNRRRASFLLQWRYFYFNMYRTVLSAILCNDRMRKVLDGASGIIQPTIPFEEASPSVLAAFYQVKK